MQTLKSKLTFFHPLKHTENSFLIPFHIAEPEGVPLHSASRETDFVMQRGP